MDMDTDGLQKHMKALSVSPRRLRHPSQHNIFGYSCFCFCFQAPKALLCRMIQPDVSNRIPPPPEFLPSLNPFLEDIHPHISPWSDDYFIGEVELIGIPKAN